ncbi:7-carboxy-7-deazaguanine synthase QueE [Helicobacter suis]|uniref:7-carboxy-7-deazaguanine synthase QueE n=1 Tax=Helicobacter suis TaxID=104628 RepID=UPI0013D221D3|nr:7-carboxy-7-deazaguanine synthase QueE [Helicobacter suis]
MSLPLVETFYSLQGEGSCVGQPSIFIRLGGCNFKCVGFGVKSMIDSKEVVGCDSAYAVYPNAKWSYLKSSQELLARLEPLIYPSTLPHIVLTGGEPSLHFNNPILLEALQVLHTRGHSIWVESNGSVCFEFKAPLHALHFTLSPKLAFAQTFKDYSKPLQNILNHAKQVVFKFVVKPPFEVCIAQIKALLKPLHFKKPPLIYLMPLGVQAQEILEGLKNLAPLCLQHGYLLSQRLHILLWGNKPGV